MPINLNTSSKNFPNKPLISNKRLLSIDLLRGLVMVLMALDHTRSFFSNVDFNPLDLDRSNFFLFFTRWITHLCAPSFIFIAGVSAYLSLQRGKSHKQLSRFLLIRGFWLIFLELTIVSLSWTFYPGFFFAGVLWVIGWSMIVLALLIRLPQPIIAIFGVLLILGHNLFDTVSAESLGYFSWLWSFLHERTMFTIRPEIRFFLGYPLIPWVGVMAAGYAFAPILIQTKSYRVRWLRRFGWGLIFIFVLLRGLNLYGDPQPWSVQSPFWKTFLSFINCYKYPPSLLYLLITLGLAFLLLYLFETKPKFLLYKPLLTLGKIPLFFYIIHLWLIHFLAVFLALPKYGFKAIILPYLLSSAMPDDYGYSLFQVYLLWLLVLLLVYPLCYWFGKYKSRHKYWWLNYF